MKLVLLDRDGVVVVNRPTNIKVPADLSLIGCAAEGIRRLNQAGYTVAICTNQPEVGRGVMTQAQLDVVHQALQRRLGDEGARVDHIFSCTSFRKCPRRKPAGGMLREALTHYGAQAPETPFVGDQADDLKAAFHAGCRRVLVRTGLGAKTLADGLPAYVRPVTVADNLRAAALAIVHQRPASHRYSGRWSNSTLA
jgi:D-glycero-D-manno-heptose 1,7-bisphosphate phosphatase